MQDAMQPMVMEMATLRAEAERDFSDLAIPAHVAREVRSAIHAAFDAAAEPERAERDAEQFAIDDVRLTTDYRRERTEERIKQAAERIADKLATAEQHTANTKALMLNALLPQSPGASDARTLDTKADLVRLLDAQPTAGHVHLAAVELAAQAMGKGDRLTAHVLMSDLMTLYYTARGADPDAIRRDLVLRSADPRFTRWLADGPRSLDGLLTIARHIADMSWTRASASMRQRANRAA